MDFIKEFIRFLLVRKKYWLIPIIILLVLFGGIIVMTQGTAVAPLIYTIFQMTYILGISAFYHDSAACLLKGGEIISMEQTKIDSINNLVKKLKFIKYNDYKLLLNQLNII